MPLDGDPVIQCLKWQLRIRRCFDLDDHEPALGCDAQQINNVSFLANEARHLGIDVSNINRRKYPAYTADQIGLQPPLLVSVSERMPAAVPPHFANFVHHSFDWLAQWVADALLRYSRDFKAAQPYGDSFAGNNSRGFCGIKRNAGMRAY